MYCFDGYVVMNVKEHIVLPLHGRAIPTLHVTVTFVWSTVERWNTFIHTHACLHIVNILARMSREPVRLSSACTHMILFAGQTPS